MKESEYDCPYCGSKVLVTGGEKWRIFNCPKCKWIYTWEKFP